MDNEIKSLQDKGAIHKAPVSDKEPGFVSSLFMVPKKGGGQRPVINLKALNNFGEYSHFKMEGIHKLRDLFKKRRLHCQIGPQRRIFHRSSVDKPSKVSEISVEGHNVGIRLPSLWPSQCTDILHQAHETSGGDVAQNECKTNSLPRQHFNNG